MFNVTKFQGGSESYSPLTILKELDRLLLLAGWTRTGLDPATLNSAFATLPASENLARRGPFGYRHASGEHMWFYVLMPWYRSGTNYHSGLTFQWTLKPAWDVTVPPELLHLHSSYWDGTHSNETAEWYVAAGDDGLYVHQVRGDRPGGFSIERLPDGRWLTQFVENQHRWGDRTGSNLYTLRGGWDGWHQDSFSAGLCRLDAGRFARLGSEASTLWLSFSPRELNGSTVLTELGTAQRGYWYHTPGTTPVMSNLSRAFFEPSALAAVEENGEQRTYRRLSSFGAYVNLNWRTA